jgi:hypothetical protein
VDEWGRVDMGLTRSAKSCRQELLGADSAALQVPDIANIIAQIDAELRDLRCVSVPLRNQPTRSSQLAIVSSVPMTEWQLSVNSEQVSLQ